MTGNGKKKNRILWTETQKLIGLRKIRLIYCFTIDNLFFDKFLQFLQILQSLPVFHIKIILKKNEIKVCFELYFLTFGSNFMKNNSHLKSVFEIQSFQNKSIGKKFKE